METIKRFPSVMYLSFLFIASHLSFVLSLLFWIFCDNRGLAHISKASMYRLIYCQLLRYAKLWWFALR